MLYEKRINSFAGIMSELGALDPDGGVRSVGRFNSRKCFVFVTRSAEIYTVALYSIKSVRKEKLPDKRLLVKAFANIQNLEKFLSGVVSKPVRGAAY